MRTYKTFTKKKIQVLASVLINVCVIFLKLIVSWVFKSKRYIPEKIQKGKKMPFSRDSNDKKNMKPERIYAE
jgi:hypothetical protein